MNTIKFKIICDGLFVGFIFITENNLILPLNKIGTIWPFKRQTN